MKQSWTSVLFASAFGVGLLAATPDLSLAHTPYPSINWRQHQQQSRMYTSRGEELRFCKKLKA